MARPLDGCSATPVSPNGGAVVGKGANVTDSSLTTVRTQEVACRTGRPDLLKLLLKHGAALDAQASDGTTALIRLTLQGNVAAAEMLITYGASIDLADNEGRTAWMHAVRHHLSAVVALLVGHGASTDTQ